MDISEFITYVQEKYQLELQYPWSDFPGFSVFIHKNTQKWIACLMRQWDYEEGMEIQRADFKCQSSIALDRSYSFLTKPFRMKGPNWVGVIFDERTQPEVIFRLFDLAYQQENNRGFTIVLDQPATKTQYIERPNSLRQDTAEDIPDKIIEMLHLYEYENHSFEQKCMNFYRQGKFMEAYEDHAPCRVYHTRYFPTYHDLNIRQLRGYFTWRTEARQGKIDSRGELYAYIYAYELLNDIGICSFIDGLEKLNQLKEVFQETGSQLVSHLNRWMLDYVIIHQIPRDLAMKVIPSILMDEDQHLAILHDPQNYTEEEVFHAFFSFASRNTQKSIIFQNHQAKAKHLFASIWLYLAKNYQQDGQDLFTLCFGKKTKFTWHPLSNAVYWSAFAKQDQFYSLNDARSYAYVDGDWYEERYDPLQINLSKIQGMLREIDRRLRQYLKVGHYLRKNPEELWVSPYIDQVLEEEKRRELEKQRPQIQVNFSQLDKIRQDALITRDQLLTEEEIEEDTKLKPEVKLSEEKIDGLDEIHGQILWALLKEKQVDTLIKEHHLLPSIVAETINEAFLDDIGDQILECDGKTITLIEDYKEDILDILGGEKA